MNKLKQELKQLKIQIRVGIEQKQISQDWGILLLDNLEEAINYTRFNVSNRRELLLDFLKEQEYCGLVEILEDNFEHYVDEYLKEWQI